MSLKVHHPFTAYAAIVALCLAVSVQTVSQQGFFLGDDFGLVHHLHDLPLYRFASYFVSDWTEGIYGYTLDELRPVLAFTYWLDSHAFGAANAPGYHITNVALHVLNSLLVFAIARSVSPSRTELALLASCLFALMPSHAEPIAWISGRVDSLAAAFYLGAFLSFLRFRGRRSHRWLALALVLFAFGLFAKQSVVTFPLLVIGYDAVYGPRVWRLTSRQILRQYAIHIPFVVVLALYLGLRRVLFGTALREDLLTREVLESFLSRQPFYLAQMVPIPSDISADARAAAALCAWSMLAAWTVWLLARWRQNREVVPRLIFFGVIWYAVTIAPMVVTYVSARHLYLTAAGLSIALASMLLPEGWRDVTRTKAALGAAVGLLLVFYASALTSNIRGWIANSADSRRFADAIPMLLQPVPAGSTVMVDIPRRRRDMWFWSWALPFALQQPHMREDLYRKFAIVEWPTVYCCPPDQWWAAKQPALGSILRSAGSHALTYIVEDQRNPGSLIRVTRVVSGAALRMKIEASVGRSIEALATSITNDEAQRIAEIIFE